MSRLRFDTRTKKPKLYGLLIETIVVLIAILILYRIPGCIQVTAILLKLYLITVVVHLFAGWVRQIQYNPYSYNTLLYFGFGLFFLSLLITVVPARLVYPGQQTEFDSYLSIASILMGSAKTYMLMSYPFILLFSLALVVSNIALIRHEGKRLVNLLGILLAILMVGGELFLWKVDYYVSGSQREVMIHDLITNTFACFYLYFLCMLFGAMAATLLTARYEPDYDKDYMIILGCGIRKDGTPTPLLKGRIDRALAFAEKQKEMTGKDLIFVPSGGQGSDEVISESACMKQYLLEHGVPEERILMEDQSDSTFQNMKFSKEKILSQGDLGKAAFSTTRYHVFRGGLHARRVKMKAQGIGSGTKWYFWPNAWVREFVGLLTDHRVKQLIVFLSMVLVYILLTLFNYQ